MYKKSLINFIATFGMVLIFSSCSSGRMFHVGNGAGNNGGNFYWNNNNSNELQATVATPVISPAGGEVDRGTTITITCATNGARIYYNMGAADPADPNENSTLYDPNNKPLVTLSAVTIKAVAFKSGDTASNITSASYTSALPETVFLSVSHLAGSAGGVGSDDGIGNAASFSLPVGITSDGANLYVTDNYNKTIRKIVISTGVVTTFAGTAGVAGSHDGIGAAASFNYPYAITNDGSNLYVTDTADGTIRKIVIATGEVTTFVGTAGVFGSDDGTGAAASFGGLEGITSDGTNLYVADGYNKTIRKIVIATRVVTTFAGTAGIGGSDDGIGAAATFVHPYAITSDRYNLYVTDTCSYSNVIRKIVIATRAVTTLAGSAWMSGSDDGTGAAASFYNPYGLTSDGANLYVADSGNNTIRKIVIATGVVTTFAGSAGVSGSHDGVNAAASFNGPIGMANDGTNLYVADTRNNTIRKIAISTEAVTTFAGAVSVFGSHDGIGTAASFSNPWGVTNDGTNLYVTDANSNNIRKIVIATGVVTTLAGTAGVSGSDDGTGAAASFNGPIGITNDGTNLYVTDTYNSTIRKIAISTGVVSTFAGTAGVTGSDDGTGATATFNYPYGITSDGTNLYVADLNNGTIRRIVIATRAITTFVGTAGVFGNHDDTGAAASFSGPAGVTSDGTNLYVADVGTNSIRKIVIASKVVSTLAGVRGATGCDDGVGFAVSFHNPYGITNDGVNLYVADFGSNAIRKIVIATGVVTTLTGGHGHWGYTDGPLNSATFFLPMGIDYVAGKLFVTEVNGDIREIR